jgi:AcrB/AcrD/AcrF family
MRFTDLFIKRLVLAIVVNLVILIAGLQSIRALSVRQYPRSDIAVVRISTTYVGANADLVRGFITTPLERAIASADGIDYMESSSAQSLSTITVHLRLNYDTNAALTQIQAKGAQVRNDLPPEKLRSSSSRPPTRSLRRCTSGCRRNRQVRATKAGRIVVLPIFAKMFEKTREMGWRREWESAKAFCVRLPIFAGVCQRLPILPVSRERVLPLFASVCRLLPILPLQ